MSIHLFPLFKNVGPPHALWIGCPLKTPVTKEGDGSGLRSAGAASSLPCRPDSARAPGDRGTGDRGASLLRQAAARRPRCGRSPVSSPPPAASGLPGSPDRPASARRSCVHAFPRGRGCRWSRVSYFRGGEEGAAAWGGLSLEEGRGVHEGPSR